MAPAAQIEFDDSALSPHEIAELRARLEIEEQHEALSDEEQRRLNECAELETDLASFIRAGWNVLRPGVQLEWSWHYDLICEYLTLVYERRVRRLIINISPRTLKSLLVSVFFPVWVWTKQPNHNFACASYAAVLSTEHSVMRRDLIQSEWFRERWGTRIQLAADQNEKTKFKNNYNAQMIATSVGGALGMGGNTLILDDGMSPKTAASDADTLTAHNWFDNTWSRRLNNPAEDALIVVEQRTSERDITGHVLEQDEIRAKAREPREWFHLAIPLECDEEGGIERWEFPVSGRVVEREIGEILQPRRFPPAVISGLKSHRLIWATQYQQRPAPLEGNMIKRSDIRFYGGREPETQELDEALPAKFDFILTSADCAFKDEKTSDYVCVGTIGVFGPRRYILEVTNQHLDEPATRTEILRQRAKWGSTVVLVEDKANGSAIIKNLRRHITGLIAIEPEGGKIARMYASCGEWQAGDWYVDRTAAWTEPFIAQITKFPNAAHDDQVDMMSQACIYLQRQTYVYGLTDLMKREEAMAKQNKQKPPKNRTANEEPAEAAASRLESPVAADGDTAKLDRSQVTKPDVDDKTERCPNEDCRSTLVQRVPGGGRRCGQCGNQWGQAAINKPTTTDFTKLAGRDGGLGGLLK